MVASPGFAKLNAAAFAVVAEAAALKLNGAGVFASPAGFPKLNGAGAGAFAPDAVGGAEKRNASCPGADAGAAADGAVGSAASGAQPPVGCATVCFHIIRNSETMHD